MSCEKTGLLRSRIAGGRQRYARTMYRYSTTLLPGENLENLRVEKTILVHLGDTIIFPRLPRERGFPSRDFIAIYSNKHTADVSCDDINTGKRKKKKEIEMNR